MTPHILLFLSPMSSFSSTCYKLEQIIIIIIILHKLNGSLYITKIIITQQKKDLYYNKLVLLFQIIHNFKFKKY